MNLPAEAGESKGPLEFKKPMALKGKMRGVDPQQVRDVSKQYEQQFLNSMVKAMRQTLPENEMMPQSSAEKYYREELDQKYVENWTNSGGVGFADIIYNQIMEKFGGIGAGGGKHIKPLHGPMKLSAKDNVQLRARPSTAKNQLNYSVYRENAKEPQEVLAPWNAKVIQAGQLENGKTALLLGHEDGSESRFILNGHTHLNAGDRVEAGQKVGLLSPGTHEYFFGIQIPDSPNKGRE